jgi:CxxC-x17-CxxC domain-containing protein
MENKQENEQITVIGKTNFRNEERMFGIKKIDRRNHMYVLGKTGMGKSVLLENMAIQDIKNGNGVAIVDPHGEMAERILNMVPANRVNDVVYINPADFDYPIAFNIMERVDIEYRHLVAAGLMAVFKKVWPDVWSARMEYILNNTLLALLEYPNSTLLGINRMLADKEFRKKILAKLTDPMVKAFWVNEFARYNERFQVEAIAPIQNKIGQFTSTPVIRNIIGQTKSSIDMREIMDNKKILIINLSKGKIGEDNSRLLGAMLITKLQLAAMSRADVAEEERNDFYLYVDEFQNFATDSFATILSEARKYRLNLIITHQYTAQLINDGNTKIRDAIFGNVGTMIIFRLGAEDGEFLEKEFTPEFLLNDIVNLPKYNIYLKLMIHGVASKGFSAKTLPPTPIPAKSHKDKIIKVSRERYSTQRSVIEDKISRWSEAKPKEDLRPTEFKTDDEYYKAKEGDFMELKPEERGSGMSADEEYQKSLNQVDCSKCGKSTYVNFKPDGVRPVYCKNCLKEAKREKELAELRAASVIKSAPVMKSESVSAPKTISLADLASPQEEEQEEEMPLQTTHAPQKRAENNFVSRKKKEADLSGLRDVLSQTMGEKKEE